MVLRHDSNIDYERPVPADINRVRFFDHMAQKYMKQMRLLFRGGRLWSSPDEREHWRNVVEHCLVEAIAAEELGSMLALPPEDTTRLAKNACVHDWQKRLERTAEQPNPLTTDLLRSAEADADLINVTNPYGKDVVREHLLQSNLSLEELLFYIDNICDGSVIRPWMERLADVQRRRTDLDAAFFDDERALTAQVEQKIARALQTQGIACDDATAIPRMILERIEHMIHPANAKSSVT